MDVLEHASDVTLSLSELNRVLHPGGQLIISVPIAEFPLTLDPINSVRMRLGKKPFPIGAFGFGHERLLPTSWWREMIREHCDIVEHRLLSFYLVALMENYLPSMFARILKPDSSNTGASGRGTQGASRRYDYRIPRVLESFYRALIRIDSTLFSSACHAMNLVVRAKKRSGA